MHYASILSAFVLAVASHPAESYTASETYRQQQHHYHPGQARATVQGDCINNDPALLWLSRELSERSAISCLGSPLQQHNANRYWGIQFGKNASVVVYPGSSKDVSLSVRAANATPKGKDFAFVGGAHSMTNASSAYGFVIDLSWMNASRVIQNYTIDRRSYTVVEYEGGANWLGVQKSTNGSGFTAVGARASTVGVGGFSTGGGIGFLAGAYGYATDRLRAMEIVLVSGKIVYATKANAYSDLFWALQGGGGQFAIVTKFYQEAAPEPVEGSIGVYVVADGSVQRARQNTVDFFERNTDPFSLMYFAVGYLPASQANPTADLAPRTLLTALRFGNPKNPSQQDYTATFASLLDGIRLTGPPTIYNISYYSDATLLVDPFFPEGFRRGFYGPQTTKITTSYLGKITDQFSSWVAGVLQNGDIPASAVFVLQYMFPGLNGNLPKSNDATGWPHAVAGHQTLFSPGYSNPITDQLTITDTAAFNKITHDHQATVGGVVADYPNYISPDSTGRQVWGDNMQRLIDVKQKYDPFCRIHNGKVFATETCKRLGFANIFP